MFFNSIELYSGWPVAVSKTLFPCLGSVMQIFPASGGAKQPEKGKGRTGKENRTSGQTQRSEKIPPLNVRIEFQQRRTA